MSDHSRLIEFAILDFARGLLNTATGHAEGCPGLDGCPVLDCTCNAETSGAELVDALMDNIRCYAKRQGEATNEGRSAGFEEMRSSRLRLDVYKIVSDDGDA